MNRCGYEIRDNRDETDRAIQRLFALSWLPGVDVPAAFGIFVTYPFHLIAYMDESGTHDATGVEPSSDVAAICGYVATFKNWVKFQKQWGKVLRNYEITEMHMKHFAHRKGEFEGWTEEKRRSLLRALDAVIDDTKLFALGGLVSVKDYARVLPDWAKVEVKHPYYFAVAVMLKSLVQWESHLPSGVIDFVFDQKEGFEGAMHEMFANLRQLNPVHARRLGNLNFRSSAVFNPLQAADFLAYEVRRHASDVFARKIVRGRESMRMLIKNKDVIVGYADEKYLLAHVEERERYRQSGR